MLIPETRELVAAPGSFRAPVPGARIVGPPTGHEIIHAVLLLRSKHGAGLAEQISAVTGSAARNRRFLTHEEMETQFGADAGDIALVEQFARVRGLWIVKSSAAQRLVVVAGASEHVSRAFGTTLEIYAVGSRSYRGRTGSVYIPKHLENIITGVFGLDNRPILEPNFRVQDQEAARITGALQENIFSIPEMARLHDFPARLNGTGQCVGIVALNSPADKNEGEPESLWAGGFDMADVEQHFTSLSMPRPGIATVPVLGGGNRPGSNMSVDAAVTLDVEVAGAAAPGARQAVYMAPNTTAGLLCALKEAIYDRQNAPSVIAVSWSAPEGSPAWTPGIMRALADTIAEAALLGITVCCGLPPISERAGALAPQFPASSPLTLACGVSATAWSFAFRAAPNQAGAKAETAEGSDSRCFPRPSYQHLLAPASGRLTPDISATSSVLCAFRITLGKKQVLVSATSTSLAAFWSALIAQCNQGARIRSGFLTPLLYEDRAASTFIGKAGAKPATPANDPPARTWTPTAGLGTPSGVRLLELLGGEDRPARADDPSGSHGTTADADIDKAMQDTIRGLNRLLEKSWRMASVAM